MNDKQYELIGESIWDTYQSMAYILMGEGSGGAKSQMRKELAKLKRSKGRKRTETIGTETKEDLIRGGRATLRQVSRGFPGRRSGGPIKVGGVQLGHGKDEVEGLGGKREAEVIRSHRANLRGSPRDLLAQKDPGQVAAASAKRTAEKARKAMGLEIDRRHPGGISPHDLSQFKQPEKYAPPLNRKGTGRPHARNHYDK